MKTNSKIKVGNLVKQNRHQKQILSNNINQPKQKTLD